MERLLFNGIYNLVFSLLCLVVLVFLVYHHFQVLPFLQDLLLDPTCNNCNLIAQQSLNTSRSSVTLKCAMLIQV